MTLSELTVKPELFTESSILYWRIDFVLEIVSNGITLNSSNSLEFKINQNPYNGNCSIYPEEGFAMSTNFTITCQNWLDDDGIVMRYEYFGLIFF